MVGTFSILSPGRCQVTTYLCSLNDVNEGRKEGVPKVQFLVVFRSAHVATRGPECLCIGSIATVYEDMWVASEAHGCDPGTGINLGSITTAGRESLLADTGSGSTVPRDPLSEAR